jgi:glutaconate CoA-transferase, subunit A
MPALTLDVAIVHMNRADPGGNAQYLGPDPYFDYLFCLAARRRLVSCERIVPTAELVAGGPVQSLLLNRAMVDGVIETPRGAHFTSCVPDYGRDELFQRRYVTSAASEESWAQFREQFLEGDEAEYLAQVDLLGDSR